MTPITSIYIPRIEKDFNAQFIADVFERNDIAQVSRVYLEPYKSIMKNGLNNKFNRAYIAIHSWHDTEAAYHFIDRLHSPNREARIVYNEDNWWPVDINKKPHKLASIERVLTVFEDKQADFCGDDIITTPVVRDELEEFVHIDAEKTALLRSIVAGFKKQHDDAEAFDGYVREMDDDRKKWFSEQYIYDSLLM